MGNDRRGLLIGLVLVVALAGALVALPAQQDHQELKPDDVFVASAPGASVSRLDWNSTSDYPPCDVLPSTGEASISYRVPPVSEWTTLTVPLCHAPGFRPGAVALTFGTQYGVQFGAVIPVGGWIPYQQWQGIDAQIGFRLTADSLWWLAWDEDLPCRIRTNRLRRYMAPITAFEGEPTPDGKVLVGASVQASFDCTHLPLDKIRGAVPVDLKGELTARNCQNTRVQPPPPIPAECPEA
jgi:hypothetical protein